MNIKKIFLILIIVLTLSGCVNLNNVTIDNIINNLSTRPKPANTFKNGFQFYTPRGLSVKDAGTNYVIFTSERVNYYLYLDLISYNEKKDINYEINSNSYYSKKIFNNNLEGYIEIKLWENNKYLIEIMYNYAKIEVMVDESLLKNALVNSISILNSIKYNDIIIENLLNDDNLNYTEEIFDMFETENSKSNALEYVEEDNASEEEMIIDTDYIN